MTKSYLTEQPIRVTIVMNEQIIGDKVNFNYWDYHVALSKDACNQRKLPMFQNICKKSVALETL
jgi:hypothetical protein